MSSSATIDLSNSDYDLLSKKLIGVTAKSGAGNIRFKSNVTPLEVTSVAMNGNSKDMALALHRIMLLVRPPYNSKRILSTHENYNLIFNYLLGRSL